MYIILILIPTVIIVLFAIYLIFIRQKYTLTPWEKMKFRKLLKQILNKQWGKAQIIDLDKLLHHILKASGYTGTFWEILKKEPKVLPNIQKIWTFHKLRNTLVHEFTNHTNTQLLKQADEYSSEITTILKSL